jgi:uncharacterized protein (DUF4415 family)
MGSICHAQHRQPRTGTRATVGQRLHGGGSSTAYQHAYFPARELKELPRPINTYSECIDLERYARNTEPMRNEYDFTKSKKARDIKQQAEQTGIGYQTLINQTLRESLQSNIIKHETISAEILRKVLREELALLTKEDPL